MASSASRPLHGFNLMQENGSLVVSEINSGYSSNPDTPYTEVYEVYIWSQIMTRCRMNHLRQRVVPFRIQ